MAGWPERDETLDIIVLDRSGLAGLVYDTGEVASVFVLLDDGNVGSGGDMKVEVGLAPKAEDGEEAGSFSWIDPVRLVLVGLLPNAPIAIACPSGMSSGTPPNMVLRTSRRPRAIVPRRVGPAAEGGWASKVLCTRASAA